MTSVHSSTMIQNEQLCVELLEWLSQLVTYSDVFGRIVAQTLNCEDDHAPHAQARRDPAQSNRLDAWISCDWLLRQKFCDSLHQIYMQLIPEPEFKAVFAEAFLRCYSDLSSKFIQGRGSSENSIFKLTVQLFTVPSLVPQLVIDQDMLQIILGCISAAISSALDMSTMVVNAEHAIIRYSRYAYLFNDLRYALSMPGVARHVTCGDSRLLTSWLQMLAFVQLMDPNRHKKDAHVEYESESWLHAFDLSIKLTPIQASIVDGFTEVCRDLPHDQKCQNAHSVVSMCCNVIHSWATAQKLPTTELNSPLGAASVIDVNVLEKPVSFHLPLHRFLSLLLLNCITKLKIEPAEFLRLKYLPSSFVAFLMEWPLQAMVVVAQTKIGMWRRNGHTILNQAINYQHSAVAAHMCDLDLPLIQFGASTLPAGMFLTTVLHRFGLFNWWWKCSGESSKLEVDMATECLATLIVIFSELYWYDAGLGFLERELVHKLLVGPCTHSKLRDCVLSFGSKKETDSPSSEEFDQLVSEIAIFRTPTKVSQGKYELRDSHAVKYDPYFFHLTREQHQVALDNLARVRSKQPSNPSRRDGTQLPHLAKLPKAMHGMAATLLSVEIAEMLWCPIRDSKDVDRCSHELLQAALYLLLLCVSCIREDTVTSQKRSSFIAALELDRNGDSIVSRLCHLYSETKNEYAVQLVRMLAPLSEACNACSIRDELNTTQASNEQATEIENATASKKNSKKLAARERAMAAMKKKRDRFSKTQTKAAVISEESNTTTNDDSSMASSCILCREENNESPLGHLAFAQIGSSVRHDSGCSGVHMHFCSHSMHLACHLRYTQALKQKHHGLQDFEGQHVINLEHGEFLCPMCKTICNVLIPIKKHEQASVPEARSEALLAQELCQWYNTGYAEQSQHPDPALEKDSDESALALASQIALMATSRESYSSTSSSKAVADLSQSWQSISYIVASLWLSNARVEATGVTALRSVVHNIRALSSFWWTDQSPHQQQVSQPMECLLQGTSSQTIPGVSELFSGPTLLGTDLLRLISTLVLLSPDSNAALTAFRALFVAVVVQATLASEDSYECNSQAIKHSHSAEAEMAAATVHQAVCELAGVAPRSTHSISCAPGGSLTCLVHLRFGSRGAMAAIERRCSAVLQQADILLELCFGSPDLNIGVQQQTFDTLCRKYGLPSVEFIAGCLEGRDSVSTAIGGFIQQWCAAAGAGSGAVAAEEASRGLARWSAVSLISLPLEYDELYGAVTQLSCPSLSSASEEPALCLVCGTWLCGGTNCCRVNGQGACTRHACLCAAGVGIFLLVRKCQVVLLRESWAAFYPAPYLDMHGEEDKGLKRGCRLVLSTERYNELCMLWASHSVVREISRIRNQSDRVIRRNYF